MIICCKCPCKRQENGNRFAQEVVQVAFVCEEPGEEKLQGRPCPADKAELDKAQHENLTACQLRYSFKNSSPAFRCGLLMKMIYAAITTTVTTIARINATGDLG